MNDQQKYILELMQSGYAGITDGGKIVDRRENPQAVSLPASAGENIPIPLPVTESLLVERLAKNLTAKSKFFIQCAENVVTACEGRPDDEDGYGVEADNELEAAKILYDEGWRNIGYEGHQSLACGACLDFIKTGGDDWVKDSLVIEEV
jgi:hypothetical protein